MKDVYAVSEITYTPRQSKDLHGCWLKVKVWASTDGDDWFIIKDSMSLPKDLNVKITGGFWKAMEEKNRRVTMDAVYKRFTDTGRFAALRCDKENKNVHFFRDSDVAKWLEGAANVFGTGV